MSLADSKRNRTFKEIDQELGNPKGTAFLAFKRLKHGFSEGRDFYYLGASVHSAEIRKLCERGRIYASTVNAVLLTQAGYDAVIDYLND